MSLFKSSYRLFIILILLVLSVSCSYKKKITATNIRLDPIYGSNMVFQANDSIVIQGASNSNGVIAVKLQDGLKYVTADADGRWIAKFLPFKYKGVFSIEVEGVDQVFHLDNLTTGNVWVVIGDNWLKDSPENISGKTTIAGRGANENVRIYTPSSLFSGGKGEQGEWETLNTTRKNYREIFSGILGDKLETLNNEPIGIINLAFPGTSLRDFFEKDRIAMNSAYSDSERDSILDAYMANQITYQKLADSSFKGLEREVLDRYFDDWEWSDIELPQITKKRWYLKNRISWLRKKIYISEKYITSDFTIDLGVLRGQFDFYFNGIHLANFKGESTDYKLHIPDTLVKVWTNLLTVRMVAGDSLSGLYADSPRVVNADSTYRMQIAEDWTIRTYYEPALPIIRRNTYLWPKVYSKYVLPLKGLKVNSVLLAGSIHQYADLDQDALSDVLTVINQSFDSKNNYMYLIPTPGYIDGLVNDNYYNTIRNSQLSAAAIVDWKIINTMGIGEEGSTQEYQNEMVDLLAKEICK